MNPSEVIKKRQRMNSSQVAEWLERYIDEHYGEICRLADCAEVLGKSYSYISHCFRRQYGKSPEQYLLEVRLEASKGLLRKTNLPIIDVIRSVGARDDLHFRKVFRERIGCMYTMQPS
jgi:AraC-like DNA-binding protein